MRKRKRKNPAEYGFRPSVIERLPKAICELCGAKDELRPYGPHGENICFECGMKDEKAAELAFHRIRGM